MFLILFGIYLWLTFSGQLPPVWAAGIGLGWVAIDFFFGKEPPRWMKEDMERAKQWKE